MSYKEKVIKDVVEITELTGNCIIHADVSHDDDCRIFKGKECNCVPDIKYRQEKI